MLTGIIAGLMAQGLSPNIAVSCGVFLHGRAAGEVRQRMGDTGTFASDLIARLPETIMWVTAPKLMAESSYQPHPDDPTQREVEVLVSNILSKTGCASRTEVARYASQAGLVL